MKVGIVGCGLNSDYHINFVKAYSGSEIVGIVDKDERKANECASKYEIKAVFSSIRDLIEHVKPDVIHIVTPPQTHYHVAKEAIQAKCNVLIEKPLALNLREATELFDLAEQHGVKLCAMHNHFYDPCMAGVHERVKSGDFGKIINIESYYGLNTQIPAFREYPMPNVLPWLYNMPGGVYHDFMAHPLYVMLDYTGRPLEVKVMHKSFGTLPHGIPDELRILIKGEKAFGTLTFSFAAKPHLHFVRIYGTNMMAEVDFNTMTNILHPVSSLPKAAQKATYNLSESWQLFKSTTANVINFARGKLKPYQGMKILIHRFYDSIKGNSEMPVTKQQALLVIETMDKIWQQLKPEPLKFDPIIPQSSYQLKYKEKVLVTGGTGFLGKRLIEGLVREGYPVRVLARKLSNIEPLGKLGVEIFYGDVGDKESLTQSFEGIDVVVHAAAGTSGRKKDCETGTIQGTRNILEVCGNKKVSKLIYISSCSVYGVADYKTDQLVTEKSSLEKYPTKRGDYSASKQQAESFVGETIGKNKFPIVILRPGTVFGPGGDLFTPMMGFSLMRKAFIVIGNGKFELPFVYIDNLVSAVITTIQNEKANNQTFNVVDDEKITKKQYVDQVMKKLYPKAFVVYFPYTLLSALIWGQEILFKILKRSPFLTRYRLISSQRNVRYDNFKIKTTMQWSPVIKMNEAVDAILKYEKNK
jgi:predicted dehydrogenase/nucleoside-diphosphate-sugar epimerase